MKICLVCSSGGHLLQLFLLKSFWEKYERFWVTFQKEDAFSLLQEEKKYWAFFPTNRNIKNFFKNLFLALKILLKEKPDIIISTGAGVTLSFFIIGKIIGKKLVFIEVIDRIDLPTLTGRLVYPFTNAFIVQWEEQKKNYPKALYLGNML